MELNRKNLVEKLEQYVGHYPSHRLITAISDRFELGLNAGIEVCDGFRSPVGTKEERETGIIWPGTWYDATGFGTYYTAVGAAYHTGSDLNNNKPTWNSDKLAPVYAAGDGVVTSASRQRGTWGNLIVIRHYPYLNGHVYYTRYAHLDSMSVSEGDVVTRGREIARIGDAFGQVAYHLHFDVSYTDVLENKPWDWPGLNKDSLLDNYLDPRTFLRTSIPVRRTIRP